MYAKTLPILARKRFALSHHRPPPQRPLAANVPICTPAADHLALGECADAARGHPPHLRDSIDIWCGSYTKPPPSVVLDIDDTVDIVHGHQEMAVWNAHYDERCFLPIHVYDTATRRPVAVILRPGKTPSGKEVRELCAA